MNSTINKSSGVREVSRTQSFVLLEFLRKACTGTEIELWADFEKEITQNNRFFPAAESVCEALDFCSKKAVYTLRKSEKTIFRARLIRSIDELPLYPQIIAYYSNWKFSQNSMEEQLFEQISKRLLEQIFGKESLEEPGFWGFDSEGSDAPPNNKALSGRINPMGMSYLYASEDPHTAIVEARPTIEQMVSVAEIELKKDLKLFDFCADLADCDNNESQKKMFAEIARRLSVPNYVGDTGYYATQYISQYIKKLKDTFDGIRFRSALHKGGVNIVLFDTTKDDEMKEPLNYVIKNSSVYVVNSITVSAKKVLPIRRRQYKKRDC